MDQGWYSSKSFAIHAYMCIWCRHTLWIWSNEQTVLPLKNAHIRLVQIHLNYILKILKHPCQLWMSISETKRSKFWKTRFSSGKTRAFWKCEAVCYPPAGIGKNLATIRTWKKPSVTKHLRCVSHPNSTTSCWAPQIWLLSISNELLTGVWWMQPVGQQKWTRLQSA